MDQSIDFASARSTTVRIGWLWLVALVIPLTGCTFFEGQTDRSASEQAAALAIANRVFSQGRLMPASGVIRIGAVPGDRVEAILVKAGNEVFPGQELVQLASFTGKQSELEIARRRLQEAMEQRVAKGTELEMVLATAQADQEAATAKVQFAKDQRSLVDQGSQTIESLRQQVDRLRQLTEDPLTKPLVGTLQLEQQKAQLLQEELRWNSSVAEADQSIAAAELAVHGAKKLRRPRKRAPRGAILRPGPDTPRWNKLADDAVKFLRRRGDKVKLARILGISRQRLHLLLKARTACPDAERTLQLCEWVEHRRQSRPRR